LGKIGRKYLGLGLRSPMCLGKTGARVPGKTAQEAVGEIRKTEKGGKKRQRRDQRLRGRAGRFYSPKNEWGVSGRPQGQTKDERNSVPAGGFSQTKWANDPTFQDRTGNTEMLKNIP